MSPTAPFLAPERDDDHKVGRAKASGGTVYYSVPGTVLTGSNAAAGPTLNTDYYWPWYAQTPVIIDQMATEVAGSTAGNFRMGFYRADVNWQPIGAPLADSGSISSGSTGVKTYTPGSPVYVQRGRYVSVLNSDVTGAVFRSFAYSPGTIHTSIGASPYVDSYSVGRTYAAFPTPGTAWTTANASTVMRSWVLYRVLTP